MPRATRQAPRAKPQPRRGDRASLPKLIELVREFCDARDWEQFHTPKDLAIGMATEAAELLQIFRFKANDEVAALLNRIETKQEIENEVADVLFFVLRFADLNDVDLVSALERKLEENARRYPLEKARGSNRRYDES